MGILTLVLALTALIIALIIAPIAIMALIEVKAMKRSTHSIQFMPPEEALRSAGAPVAKDEDLIFERVAKNQGLVPIDDDEDLLA